MSEQYHDTMHERTALSQHRTGLSTSILALLFLRLATFGEVWFGAFLAVVGLVVSLIELVVSRTSYRSRKRDTSGKPRRLGAALVTAAAVALVSSAGLVLAFSEPERLFLFGG